MIGRKNEFIAQQRLSEVKETVVPVTDIDDPLIADPPRLIGFDYDKERLVLTLSKPVSPKWVSVLHHIGGYASLMGYGPGSFQILGDKASVNVSRDDSSFIQQVINHFKSWLPLVTRQYEDTVRREKRAAEEQARKRLEQEIVERERRLEILRSIKI